MNEIRTSTVETLLGMLSLKPMSGYELRGLISESIGNFWSESFGQIYPALKRMVAEGLVEVEDAPSGGRERKVYSLTAAGRQRLEEWLGMPARDQVARNELLLKLFFGSGMKPEQVRALLVRKREELDADLKRYETIERELPRQHAGNPGLKFWLMTVRYGLAEARALQAWCDESLKSMEEER